MALRLHDLGFGEAYALRGGFDAWVNAGLPTEAKGLQPSAPGP